MPNPKPLKTTDAELFKHAPLATQALAKQAKAERRAKERKAWYEANRARIGGAL